MGPIGTNVVFIHGAGEGAYDADAFLVTSLEEELGRTVHYPRMPDDDDSDDTAWIRAIDEAISEATSPVVVVGHSAGGYVLLKYLATERVAATIAAVCIIAAPFPGGDPDWTFAGFALPADLAQRLPPSAQVFVYASEDDEVVPFAHRDLYAAAIPGAQTRTTHGGHQLTGGLDAVVADIRALAEATGSVR